MNEEAASTTTPSQLANPLVAMSPITAQFVKAFADDELIIDCPSITLTQQGTDLPQVISGRGMLSLQEGRRFQLRMYTDDAVVNPFDELVRMSQRVPGEIIPDTELYNLNATDLSGITWQSESIIISLHGQNHGVVATGEFDLLTSRSEGLPPSLPSKLTMWLFQEIDVPFTQLVKTEVTAGERMLQKSNSPEISSFDIDSFKFEIRTVAKEKGSTILQAHSNAEPFPCGIESRIQEALRYVTFSPITWCIVDKQHRGVREISVIPKQKRFKGLFEEPLDSRRRDCAADYWHLFSAYLRHAMVYENETRYHPLSAQLFQVITAETRQLEIVGLLVSVSVEGVLNCEFKDLAKPSMDFLAAVESTVTLIDRLRCRNGSLAARIKGSLNPMKSARAKDKLKALQNKGVVTKQMVDAWEKLRNATAHASIHDTEQDIQKMWGRCNTVYTLLNVLVFLAIGYTGKYQDFGTSGWPIKDFNPPLFDD